MISPQKSAKRPSIRWVRVARLGSFAIVSALLIVLGIFTILSYLYAHFFTHWGCIGSLESLASQGFPSEAVSFPSRQGHTLRGWFSPGASHPEIAIVVLPGASGNTFAALPDAALIAQAGYSTLVYEHRSCADPALLHSGGYWESFDLLGAVDYLKTRPDVQHVAVFGFSTGGSTSIIAAGQHAGIEAVVAMGGFASITADTLDPAQINTPLDWFVRHMVMIFYEYAQGIPVDKDSPISYIRQISPRPILLIYGEFEAAQGQMLYEAAGQPKDLWIVPGAGHGGYHAASPDEYPQRIVGFFDGVFGVER